MTRNQVKNKIENEIAKLEYKINNLELYNIEAFCKRGLLRGGLAIRKVAPFILASYIAIVSPVFNTNLPFVREKSIKNVNAVSMHTSTGYYEQYTSFDFKYDWNEIHFSTAWTQDESGMYSRTVTIFSLPDDFREKYDDQAIFNMSEEDVKKLIKINTIKKITKTKLEPEDNVYNKQTITIFNSFESDEQQKEEEETVIANIFNTLLYFMMTAGLGVSTDYIVNLIFKRRTETKIKELILRNKPLTKKDLVVLKEKLALQKENLALLSEDSPVPPEEHSLRKKGSR